VSDRYPNWFPFRVPKRNVADKGGRKKWMKNRKHLKKEFLR